jgi:hypothetical protein
VSYLLRKARVAYDNVVAGSATGREMIVTGSSGPKESTRYMGRDNNTGGTTLTDRDKIQNGASTSGALGGDTDQNTTSLGVELLTA